jgi:NIPSNAP protein
MIYELRMYSVAPGRLADVHSRFKQLPALFSRHKIECVGRWSATSGPRAPHFVYLMAYRDLAEREAIWPGFYADPDWLSLRERTNAGSEMTERFDIMFLRQSPVWDTEAALSGETIGGMHELILCQTALGLTPAVNAFLAESYLPVLRAAGAQVMGVFDMVAGHDLPQVVLMLAWRSANARQSAWHQVSSDGLVDGLLNRQRETFGRPLLGRSEIHLLEPTPFALPQASLGAAKRHG